MNIAILVSGHQLGGAERRAISIANELNKRQSVILIVTSQLLQEIQASQLNISCDVHIYRDKNELSYLFFRALARSSELLKFPFLNKFLNYLVRKIDFIVNRRLYKILKLAHIHVLHIFMEKCVPQNFNGVIIYEVVGPNFAERVNKWEDSQVELVDIFKAVSPSVFKRCENRLKSSHLYLTKTPFFDPDKFGQSNVSFKENLICFAHRFVERKNGILFARVAREFLEKHPNWKIAMLGWGPDHDEISRELKGWKDSDRLIFRKVENIESYLKSSKIFISINSKDNYPSQSVLEAMFFNNALLLSDTGSSKDMFLRDNGLVCDVNFQSVLNSLERLAFHHDLNEMGARSKVLLEERFDKNFYMAELLEVYTSALTFQADFRE